MAFSEVGLIDATLALARDRKRQFVVVGRVMKMLVVLMGVQ
jgi:hypothetical protein